MKLVEELAQSEVRVIGVVTQRSPDTEDPSLGDLYTVSQVLEDFAELAGREGKWARTTRLLGAAEALRERMAKPLQPRERAEYERYLNRARAALGEAATVAEGEAGRALSLEQAVAVALDEPGD